MNTYIITFVIVCVIMIVIAVKTFTKKEKYSSIINLSAGTNDKAVESFNQKSFVSKHDEQEYLCNSRLCNSIPSLQERPHTTYNPKNFYTF